jgi:hypothetical protein
MRSASPSDSLVEAFWQRFACIADQLRRTPEDAFLLRALDAWVRELHPSVSWEIGPGKHAAWQLAISPSLHPELLPVTRKVVSRAPAIREWEFYSTRQPKEWDLRFELQQEPGPPLAIDASDWTYVLLRYPDGRYEVVLHGTNISSLDRDARDQAAAITIEGILGEEPMLGAIDAFELTDELDPELAGRARPIRTLASAFCRPPTC